MFTALLIFYEKVNPLFLNSVARCGWSYRKKFQSGEVTLNTGLLLGYKRAEKNNKDGHAVYVMDEEEASIVRRIYREYFAGTTVIRILSALNNRKVLPTLTSNWIDFCGF